MHFFSRRYGMSVWPAINYTDCKRHGFEVVYQKMMPLVGIPFGVQRNLVCDGLLSAGQDYSPVQQILEAEISKSLDRFWEGFEVNSETIAVELIGEVIVKSEADFLRSDHTLVHHREERWHLRWMDPTPGRVGLRRLQPRLVYLRMFINTFAKLLIRYCPRDLDTARMSKLRKVVEISEKELFHLTPNSKTCNLWPSWEVFDR